MGKASAGKRDVIHRQQIAARRAAARRAQMRNRMLLAGGAIITVVAVTLALVLVKVNSKPAAAAPPADDRVIVIRPKTNRIVWQYGHDGVPGRAAGYLDNPDGVDLAPPDSLLTAHAATMGRP